jgi:hypothetical protein
MIKKVLILSLVIAAGISPFLPNVFADNASWKPLLADRVWDQSTFRVDRLTFTSGVSEPMKRNGIAFVSQPSTQCINIGLCDKIDLSLLKDGKSQTINGVDQQFLNPSFAMAQKEKFVYFTKSTDPNKWFDVSLVDSNTAEVHALTSLTRKANELSFVSFSTSGDRLYATLLQSDTKTNKVESSIIGKSFDGAYEERNIAFLLSAPWQQVMDGYNDQLLVKFQFSGGNKQLWLINPKTQVMSAIPNTWTEPQGDILFAHFLSNGKVVYFQNYRLYTFDPANDKAPQSYGNAMLSWNMEASSNVQIAGDHMAWTNADRVLYAVGPEGVTELHVVKDGSVYLEKNAMYFADAKGTWKYEFASKKTTATSFLVTDTREDVRVGVDTKGNVWFENQTNNSLTKLGYGSHPVLSDASHAIWKGTDGAIYQASLSTLLSMRKTNTVFDGGLVAGDRVKAIGETRVYLVGNDGQLHWITSETVAYSIFGTSWNKGIKEVPPTFLWKFTSGSNISSDQSIKTL